MSKNIEERIVQMPGAKLREAPKNPRRNFGDLSSLAASIRAQGIMQALVVRPIGEDLYEIVFGHRRFRAGKLAGLREFPVIIREMSEAEALEQQLVENAQRVDIHPLEQAEAYQRLHGEFGYSAEKTMQQLGITKTHLYATLKLLELAEPARKAFERGEIVESVALEIARRKGERLQLQALKDVEGMPSHEAIRHIRKHYGDEAVSKRAKGRAKPPKAAPAGVVARRLTDAVLARAVQSIERERQFEPWQVKLMTMALCEVDYAAPGLLERRGFAGYRELESAAEKKMSPAELRGLLFETIAGAWVGGGMEDQAELKAIARAFGLNLRELEAGVKYELEQEALKSEADKLFTK